MEKDENHVCDFPGRRAVRNPVGGIIVPIVQDEGEARAAFPAQTIRK